MENKGETAKAKKNKYSVDQLLNKADDHIDCFEFTLAQRFCQRALEQDKDNLRALDTSGCVHLEMGQNERAKACFSRAVELRPYTGHSKYMYLGQLLTGSDAITSFTKGLSIMENMCGATTSDVMDSSYCDEGQVTKRDISNGYCAIAEIYLTDQCQAEGAEQACQTALNSALATDAVNPEALQLSASLRLCQQDKPAARQLAEQAVNLWLPQLREAMKPDGAQVDLVEACPVTYPARLTAAKLLVEVEHYELAAEVLELLLDEEDRVVEVWYLLGWLNYLQGADYHGNARHYLTRAADVARQTQYDDGDVTNHITELLDALGLTPDEEGDDAADGEDKDSDEAQGTDGDEAQDMDGDEAQDMDTHGAS